MRTSILEDLDAYPRTRRRPSTTPSTAKSQFSYRIEHLRGSCEHGKVARSSLRFVCEAEQAGSEFKQRSRRESQRSELRILVESTVQMVYQRVCCRQPPHLIG
ncbi:hypothetical protein CZ774_00545 [Frigoribacterium sp. JB110]|nr:hypothetical protein CZ774_00545 [Frigoribacterium sp. JB110]